MKYIIPFLLLACTPMGNHVPPAADTFEPSLGKDACTAYKWKDRSVMPIGFARGVIESYRRARAKGEKGRAIGDASKDALAYYGLGQGNELRKTYAFLFGLGMRESSGNYSLGRDYTAKGPQNSSQAESGAWQFSYDSIGADPALRKIYSYYQENPQECLTAFYAEGVKVNTTGYITSPQAGYEFQKFMRSCPAAQAEYAAVMIRVNRKHFGPINRVEVEYRKECEDLLASYE